MNQLDAAGLRRGTAQAHAPALRDGAVAAHGGSTGLDRGKQGLRCDCRLHRIVDTEQLLQVLVDAQGAAYVAVRDALVHKPAAGVLVRRIEIDERERNACLARAAGGLGFLERPLQRAQQPVAVSLALRQHPASECRIDMLQSTQQIVGKTLTLQQERMNVAHSRRIQNHQRVNVDGCRT